MTQTRAIPLTVILRCAEQGAGFTGFIAELPGTHAEGESLSAVRGILREQVAAFFDGNRAVSLLNTSDAMTETLAVAMLAFPNDDDPDLFAVSFDLAKSVSSNDAASRIVQGVPVADLIDIERLLRLDRRARRRRKF